MLKAFLEPAGTLLGDILKRIWGWLVEGQQGRRGLLAVEARVRGSFGKKAMLCWGGRCPLNLLLPPSSCKKKPPQPCSSCTAGGTGLGPRGEARGLGKKGSFAPPKGGSKTPSKSAKVGCKNRLILLFIRLIKLNFIKG
jgi:hypothetical protein